jgi:molybdate transport system substrate-binding protein
MTRQGDQVIAESSKMHLALKLRGVALVVVAALLFGGSGVAQSKLTISAAASLKEAIEDAESVYRHGHGDVDFTNNYGASGMLAAQIDQGAPVDIFLSAAAKQMDDLQNKGLIATETRRNLLRNALVLIVPMGSQLRDFQGLTQASVRVIAVGDPASVPAGQYGKQTLTALHLQDQLQAKFVFAKDVRQVLTYVETGNADAGLVYGSDALTSSKVRVVATAPDSSHDPIVYPAAVLKRSHAQEAARRFVEFLATPAAQAIFQKHGFTPSAQ